eukprot:COSAG05_NODE_23984_length_254_cov_1.000000_1_plen_68_part_10
MWLNIVVSIVGKLLVIVAIGFALAPEQYVCNQPAHRWPWIAVTVEFVTMIFVTACSTRIMGWTVGTRC